MKSSFIFASAQYQIDLLKDWTSYQNKIKNLVDEAKQLNAKLLVFPEYMSLELMQWSTGDKLSKFQDLQKLHSPFIDLFQSLAKQYQITICAGTFPVAAKNNQFLNRAYLFSSNGTYDYQDKLFLTMFEIDSGLIACGEKLNLFDNEIGKIGIAICYDSEFPFLVHDLVARGADLILVPSCTDTMAGLNRVSISCRARALENQCYVVQASLLGKADWIDMIDMNVGRAGIYSPIDVGCPEDGILIEGEINVVQLVHAEINISKLDSIRRHCQVTNFMDMKKSKQMF